MADKTDNIPFNRPTLTGRETEFIRRAVDEMHTAGGGPFTRRCVKLLIERIPVEAIHLTTSCTAALEMCALLLELQPGDEVIVPAFSFVSDANAFALRGARPVFVDIRPDTLNLDERRIDERIGPRTRAILAVHYAGVGCEMETILATAERHGLAVIEDNAHGLFASYRDRPLGTFGCLATQSFHETKNLNCGEGGALLINDSRFVEPAEIIRDKGTNRQQLYRGQVDKYTWVALGSSYVLADILAAYLYAQLLEADHIMAARRELWERYDAELRDWAEEQGIQSPHVPGYCRQGYHMYYLILPEHDVRQRLIAHLAERGIDAVFHYTPLNGSKMGQSVGGAPGDCPVTETVSDRLLRLPFHQQLSADDQRRVVAGLKSFF